jgi:hypothetical protein
MSNREAPPRIVPRVFCEDGGGYSRPAKCALCLKQIRKSNLLWGHLPSDPEGVRRPVHRGCISDYIESVRTIDLPSLEVAPTL